VPNLGGGACPSITEKGGHRVPESKKKVQFSLGGGLWGSAQKRVTMLLAVEGGKTTLNRGTGVYLQQGKGKK